MKNRIIQHILNNKGALIFVVIMLIANVVWKVSVEGDEACDKVLLFGVCDISNIFTICAQKTADITYCLAHQIDDTSYRVGATMIRYPNGNSVEIAWSCTGIKQCFIFFTIMLFSFGNWKNKLWFIPVGLIMCCTINIFRTTILTLIINEHRNIFDLMHNYILKYLYYLLIFIFWVAWEEKFKYFNFKKWNAKK